MQFNPNAEIIAGSSLGGVKLLDHISQYWDSIVEYQSTSNNMHHDILDYHTAVYEFPDSCIELSIHMPTGSIYRISTSYDYKGKFHEKITVGMPITELNDMNLGFEYSDNSFSSPLFPGLLLELDPEINPLPEELPYYEGLEIDCIEVFDPEYVKANGLSTHWW